MPNDYDEGLTSFQNPDLFAIDARLADRKARLKLAAKAAAEGTGLYATPTGPIQTPGFQSAVTGANIVGPSQKQPLLANLTPLIADIGNAIDQKGYEEDQSGYRRAEQAAAQAHMAQRPPDDADESTKLQWAQRGAETIPSLKPTMDAYVQDQIVKAPERQEARAERIQTRADALAEAQRKQQEELQYRRERDQREAQLRRDLADQNSQLRRDLNTTVAASGAAAAGDKASNYQIVQDQDGNLTRVNKLTGEVTALGSGGRAAASVTAASQKAAAQVGQSQDALQDIGTARDLLKKASGGKGVSLRDTIAGAAGYTTDNAKITAALTPIGESLTRTVPRFEGPQSDKDVAAYRAAAADVANPDKTPTQRIAALDQVERMHRRVLDNAARSQAAAHGQSSPPNAPTVRDSVKAAARQQSGGWSVERE